MPEWIESFLLCFLHYTDAKICLSGEELNNDVLEHNKHMIKGRILLGWALEGRDSRAMEIFTFSTLSTLPNRIYPLNTPDPIYVFKYLTILIMD